MHKPRNPVARSPLLRKGGAHTTSKTGQRVQARLNTQDAIDEWLEELNDNQQEQQHGEQTLPDHFLGPAQRSDAPRFMLICRA